MSQQLNEQLLKSDFTFGFELEGCARLSDYGDYNNEYDYYSTSEEYDLEVDNEYEITGERARAIENNLNNLFNERALQNDIKYGDIQNDCSINPYGDDNSFEWASPVMDCTPANFQRTIYMVTHLDDIGVYTNSSCGFHHHLTYKGITERDIIWIYLSLCMDNEFRHKMTYLGDIDMNSTWAPTSDLDDIRDSIIKKDWKRILSKLSDEKYRQFRIHPYGTIEWRGPRDFLNDQNIEVIKSFYKKFNYYINKIIEYQARDTIFDTDITKDELFSALTKAKESDEYNKDRELEFLYRTHGYNDRPLNIKTKRGTIISEKLMHAMMLNPEIFYNFVMEKRKGLQSLIANYEYNFVDILDKLYEMGVSNEKQFAENLFQLLTSVYGGNITKAYNSLREFKVYIDESVILDNLTTKLNNGEIYLYDFINTLNRSDIVLNARRFYQLIYSQIDNSESWNGFVYEMIFGYIFNHYRYEEEIFLKLNLMILKIAYKNNFLLSAPAPTSSYYQSVMSDLSDDIKTIWNNRIIGALFEKPQLYSFASFIINTDNLDLKALIALCSRYDKIFAKLDTDIRFKIKNYVKD